MTTEAEQLVREAVESCKESYALSMESLANLVAAAIDSDAPLPKKIVWLGISVDMVGIHNEALTRAYFAKLDSLVTDKEAYEEARFAAMMTTTQEVLNRAARLSQHVGDLYGFKVMTEIDTEPNYGFYPAGVMPPPEFLQ